MNYIIALIFINAFIKHPSIYIGHTSIGGMVGHDVGALMHG